MGSDLEAPTFKLADQVETILTANSTPFFPAYTDHGTRHVELVLAAAVRLIPEQAWKLELLTAADAAVLACACMLHDLAMHVQPPGFVELVTGSWPSEARPWFSADRVGRRGDVPWPRLWKDFQREARHFGPSQLELIFGPAGSRVPAVAHEDRLDPGKWVPADLLLIGEFLRRHHARLSHEIAIHGFPGATAGEFPVLSDTMPDLAEAIGAVARSHNEPLRVMLAYLDYVAPGALRPSGALLAFHMGLLRVADYLQIEAPRAPSLLLRLKAPESPVSVEEWNKHGAVSSLSWDHRDPLAVFVTVSPRHTLRTHLALESLLADMQREFDTTAGVLSELYSSGDLASLRLTRRRVLTNLHEPSLTDQLPYLPLRARLESDQDLFRLVVRDLYGSAPSVAGRELIQNAVDAVRARRVWEDEFGPARELRELPADVFVTVEDHGGGKCTLRVADRGIGMTPDLVVRYFLRAGASFGPTREELDDLTREQATSRMKAGRFGVGAFAAFLLGPEIHVTTRHAGEERGLTFRACIDEDLVEITRAVDVPVGTEVVIGFDDSIIPRPSPEERKSPSERLMALMQGYYRLTDPKVAFVHESASRRKPRQAPADVPSPDGPIGARWRAIEYEGFDAIRWRIPHRLALVDESFDSRRGAGLLHNGIVIRPPDDEEPFEPEHDAYEWSEPNLNALIRRPGVATFDSRHTLGVALHRYRLVQQVLPFETALLDSIGRDLVGHALTAGARHHPLTEDLGHSPIFGRSAWCPALPSLMHRCFGSSLLAFWSFDSEPPTPAWNDDPFFAVDGSISWERFPARIVLGPRSRAENAFAAVSKDVARWESCFAARKATTVIAGAMRGDRPSARASGDWRVVDDSSARGDDPVFALGTPPASPDLETALTEVALMLAEGRGVVGLCVFSDFGLAGPAQSRVAEPWLQTIDGPLPRDATELATVANQLLAAGGWLPPLSETWKRTLDEVEDINSLVYYL